MSVNDLLRTALRSVANNKLRSLLTMLGVIIGVASVISMLALGNGARAAVEKSFQYLGANQLQIGQKVSFEDGEFKAFGKTLISNDGMSLLENIPKVSRVDMSVAKDVKVRYDRISLSINALGTTDQALEKLISDGSYQPAGWNSDKSFVKDDLLEEGRFFSSLEITEAAPVCVLGYQTMLDLFGGISPINQTITINRMRCTIIGVLKELETVDISQRYSTNPNILLVIPINTMIQNFFDEEPSLDLVVHVQDANQIDEVKQKIIEHLRQLHEIEADAEGNFEDDFSITTRKDILGRQQEAANTFSILLTSMAIVSLVVGGIGIMNVMLVSVTERTREIGLRRALGAKDHDIVNQFLLEAVFISISGGVIGIIAGIFTIPIAATLNQGMALLMPESIPLSLGVSICTGILFGLYPAIRASRLDPIESLRSE
ncbi:MAG: ABC transporter permease [Anaerolineaceae bacterium]|nr:ABC transporter permease [Anaerolineaceae bacterium]